MDARRLDKLHWRLHNRIPLLGGWLRRRAAQALANDGSPDALRTLIHAVILNSDERVRGVALDTLRAVMDPHRIDVLCFEWAASRHPDLTRLLLERRWLASQPTDVRLLTALKLGHLKVVA